jgi:phosphoglucosamine mutase
VKDLFGTDGIRGTANQYPITVDIITKVGQALGFLLLQAESANKHGRRKVVIGKDTRLSGYMVEMALASGLNSMGVDVQLLGPLPTPGIGYLTRNMRADAGVVISASHNPYKDNGIKIFGPDGFKISEHMEKEIEKLVLHHDLNKLLPVSEKVGRSKRIDDAAGRYIVYVKSTFPLSQTLDGLRVVLDCANGAAYKVGPAVFEELGAEVIVIGNQPNGTNINEKCGALYPAKVSEAVKAYRADVGISLDGDADRCIIVDDEGHIVNGDHILAICGIHLKKKGLLVGQTVVTTQMANFGLDQAMAHHGIKLLKTKVGDKYVVEEMRKGNYTLGGESSGHIVFLDRTTTGDGLIASLSVLSVVIDEGKRLSELNKIVQDVPQVLRNIHVGRRAELDTVPGYKKLIDEIDEKLKGKGRTFVRFSGTEPLVRVLVEGPDEKAITDYADQISALLQKSLS